VRRTSGRPLLERVLVGAAAAAFVFVPVATPLLGMRAHPLENRPLAKAPSLDAGWGVFAAASSYASDHLPIREAAVHVNQRVVDGVFQEPPSIAASTVNGVAYPRVVLGQDSWLFYGGDFQSPCTPLEPATATVARLSRLAAVLRASGRKVVVTVVPDKSSIVRDRLPDRYIGRTCAAARKAAFWAAFTAAGQPDLLDLRPALRRADALPGRAYYRSDTHWTPLGQVTYARQVVKHLAPGVWQDSQVHRTGTTTHAGDLGPMVERTAVDVVPRYSIARTKHLVPGSTAVVGDSFSDNSRGVWGPWFSTSRFYHRTKSTRAAMLQAMTSSRSVVVEVVERDASRGALGRIDDAFVDDLEAALAGK
jgi:alginate O-acetyltransferase complex protein AlgJ